MISGVHQYVWFMRCWAPTQSLIMLGQLSTQPSSSTEETPLSQQESSSQTPSFPSGIHPPAQAFVMGHGFLGIDPKLPHDVWL